MRVMHLYFCLSLFGCSASSFLFWSYRCPLACVASLLLSFSWLWSAFCIRWCDWISHSFLWMCFLKVLFNIWCNYNRHQATTLMQKCLWIHTLRPSEVLCHFFFYFFFPKLQLYIFFFKSEEGSMQQLKVKESQIEKRFSEDAGQCPFL